MTVIWITGLSGAGKTTLANEVTLRLREMGRPTVFLDGDQLRAILGADEAQEKNHSRAARLALAQRYSELCALLARQNFTVVIATISLFHEIHEWNRKNLPGYFEVYLKVPLIELKRRDPKGIYRRFERQEIANVAGLDLAVDEPRAPDCTLEQDGSRKTDELADQLLKRLEGVA